MLYGFCVFLAGVWVFQKAGSSGSLSLETVLASVLIRRTFVWRCDDVSIAFFFFVGRVGSQGAFLIEEFDFGIHRDTGCALEVLSGQFGSYHGLCWDARVQFMLMAGVVAPHRSIHRPRPPRCYTCLPEHTRIRVRIFFATQLQKKFVFRNVSFVLSREHDDFACSDECLCSILSFVL